MLEQMCNLKLRGAALLQQGVGVSQIIEILKFLFIISLSLTLLLSLSLFFFSFLFSFLCVCLYESVFWAIEQGKTMGILQKDDSVVVVHGWQTGPGYTNTVRILNVV